MNVFIDATAPTAPNNPDLRTDNDKGTLDDDNLTNISDLFFSVSGLSSSGLDSIFITKDGTAIGSELSGGTSQNVYVTGATTGGTGHMQRIPLEIYHLTPEVQLLQLTKSHRL